MARGAAKLALALGALLPGGARGQTYVGPEYIPAAEHPMPMWLSPPKEAAVASCAIDVGNAMVFLGQAGTSINEAVKKCDRQKTDTERAACSASVSGVLAGFGFAAGFLQLAAADCQSSFTVLKPAAIAQAACGADIANFVASLALLADAGSSIHNTCREEKGFKDVHKQSSWVQHRASELSGMAGIASSKLEKTMKDGKMVLHFSGASPGQPTDVLLKDRSLEITECVFDVGQATFMLARAGLMINSAVADCSRFELRTGGVPSRAKCAVDVSSVISAFAFVSQGISGAVYRCPFWTALAPACASAVSNLVAALAQLAASGASFQGTCGFTGSEHVPENVV